MLCELRWSVLDLNQDKNVAYRIILSVFVTVHSSLQPFNNPLTNCVMVMKLGVNAISPLSQFLISPYEQYQWGDRTDIWGSWTCTYTYRKKFGIL